ncbi:hypothetical protein BCR34DRAFT_583861 [Clohesyomyces aquaticus]|uniref:Uncharacterized protein n=1 Tax=Clohesyomyces aquaticus TaxID=1231657 RepID=A0A1Y2A4Z2_9PLEO|nr:hypothetical protein BCR34DRAFT_583861 [Clohesyomyces aquaticus]
MGSRLEREMPVSFGELWERDRPGRHDERGRQREPRGRSPENPVDRHWVQGRDGRWHSPSTRSPGGRPWGPDRNVLIPRPENPYRTYGRNPSEPGPRSHDDDDDDDYYYYYRDQEPTVRPTDPDTWSFLSSSSTSSASTDVDLYIPWSTLGPVQFPNQETKDRATWHIYQALKRLIWRHCDEDFPYGRCLDCAAWLARHIVDTLRLCPPPADLRLITYYEPDLRLRGHPYRYIVRVWCDHWHQLDERTGQPLSLFLFEGNTTSNRNAVVHRLHDRILQRIMDPFVPPWHRQPPLSSAHNPFPDEPIGPGGWSL